MKSLRSRLMWHLLAGGVLLLGFAGFALHWQVKRALIAEFDSSLRVALHSLSTLVELEVNGGIGIEGGAENLTDFNKPDAQEVFLLSAADGREIVRSRSLGGDALPPHVGAAGQPSFFDATFRNGIALRCAGIRFLPRLEDEKQSAPGGRPEVVLLLGRERATVDRSLAALRTALVLTGVGTIAALACILGWGVRRGLQPVKQLGEAVAHVDAASLSTRFATEPLPDELRPIAERLNDLLARLELSFSRERRFTATAAHELRTPLAELRTLAEVNLATPASESEHVESWKDALASTRRMESLALHLLELTRAEDSQRVVHKVRVAVADAVAAAWKPHAEQARPRGISLSATIAPDVAVSSDPVLLGVVLGNLFGNAAVHGRAGSPFSVTAERKNDVVEIHFRNRADALEEKDVAHLFERFWTKDESRSDAEHHGLGLSVAHDFTRLLGGTLAARLHHVGEGVELEFVLSLPCAQQDFHSSNDVPLRNLPPLMSRNLILLPLAACCLAGCAHFSSKPLDARGSAARLTNRRLTAKTWTLKALIDEAVRNHPDVALARAQYETARAAIHTANERPNPTLVLTPQLAGPFNWMESTYGVELDWTFETAGKRAKRVDVSRANVNAASCRVVDATWKVRAAVRKALLELYAAERRASLVANAIAKQEELLKLIDARVKAGAVSHIEMAQPRLMLVQLRMQQADAGKGAALARASLAESLGMGTAGIEGAKFSFAAFENTRGLSSSHRRAALTHRADVLAALADYAAAEAALRLEVAKQYPDVHFNPGYSLDSAVDKWALGLSVI